jgi:hypothetical protein
MGASPDGRLHDLRRSFAGKGAATVESLWAPVRAWRIAAGKPASELSVINSVRTCGIGATHLPTNVLILTEPYHVFDFFS